MKVLLAICVFFTSTFVWATETPAAMAPAAMPPAAAAPAFSVTGKVLEVKNVDSYTYLRLNTQNGEMWAAVMKAPVKKGSTVSVENAVVMNNFESKSLKKTFPTILFGTLGGAAAAVAPSGHGMGGTAYPLVPGKKLETINDAPVAKASGENARTVAEIITKRAELKDKPVLLRGKVVKFNPAIMGKNWIHLRDGSGSAADDTNDILVTSAIETKVGDIVTVKGTIRTDKDFGSGYAYKVLIEEATLQ
jgi:hypothetical protein